MAVKQSSSNLKQSNRIKKSIIIGAIYRHPHENHDIFYTRLDSCLAKLTKKYRVILCGDTNEYQHRPYDKL